MSSMLKRPESINNVEGKYDSRGWTSCDYKLHRYNDNLWKERYTGPNDNNEYTVDDNEGISFVGQTNYFKNESRKLQ
jgi:hypothetical protein